MLVSNVGSAETFLPQNLVVWNRHYTDSLNLNCLKQDPTTTGTCGRLINSLYCISTLCNKCLQHLATSAHDISTGPTHFSDRRASTFYLSLAHTGHLHICRATRFQIVLARTMTNHSMYFLRGRPSHISAVFAQSFCYSETPACRESGMSIKHTDISV